MTSREFCYWLQGFFEIRGELQDGRGLDEKQVAIIKKHLDMVFVHEIDGSYPDREVLDAIHSGGELKVPPELQKQIDELKKELARKTEELRKQLTMRPPSSPFGPTMRC